MAEVSTRRCRLLVRRWRNSMQRQAVRLRGSKLGAVVTLEQADSPPVIIDAGTGES